jgi:DeoR/GlpR family transcriptional regulator of sugar metabolism
MPKVSGSPPQTAQRPALIPLLLEQGFVAVAEMAKRFNVSEMTIRRDIRGLEKSGRPRTGPRRSCTTAESADWLGAFLCATATFQRRRQAIVLADKFGNVSTVRITGLAKISIVVTESQPQPDLQKALRAAGVQVIVANGAMTPKKV